MRYLLHIGPLLTVVLCCWCCLQLHFPISLMEEHANFQGAINHCTWTQPIIECTITVVGRMLMRHRNKVGKHCM